MYHKRHGRLNVNKLNIQLYKTRTDNRVNIKEKKGNDRDWARKK